MSCAQIHEQIVINQVFLSKIFINQLYRFKHHKYDSILTILH